MCVRLFDRASMCKVRPCVPVICQQVYVQPAEESSHVCFLDSFVTEQCLIATRNNPLHGWSPAFIAWPTTVAHVQACIAFATKHNLCVAVAGTGHDFQNRHSCDQGLLIRTTLFKEQTWNLTDPRGQAGTVTFGAGTVFLEAHAAASQHSRCVVSFVFFLCVRVRDADSAHFE